MGKVRQSSVFLLLALILCSLAQLSCSLIIENLGEQKDNFTLLPEISQTYCPLSSSEETSFVGPHHDSVTFYQSFLENKTIQSLRLSFIEETVLWSLVQMSVRPHVSSPTSRLQVLVSYKGEQNYWDFRSTLNNPQKTQFNNQNNSKDGPKDISQAELTRPLSLSYLYGLEKLLKAYPAKRSLRQLAAIMDKYFYYDLKVDSELAKFFAEHKATLQRFPPLKRAYFKGDEILKVGETLPRFSYVKLVDFYLSEKAQQKGHSLTNQYLFPYSLDQQTTPPESPLSSAQMGISCNYDMGLYENSIFLIDQDIVGSNTFGLSVSGGNHFLAVSAQHLDHIGPIGNSVFIAGEQKGRTAALCFVEVPPHGSAPGHTLSFVSTESRDPGQHLFHLLKYDLDKIADPADLDLVLKHSRYLFLTNPIRLVFESRRGSKKKLEELLKLDIPVYHSLALGKVWAHFSKGPDGQRSFVIDDRREGNLRCPYTKAPVPSS